MTSHRWDTTAHRPDEPHRVTPFGTEYGPYHEVQAMMEGPAAASLGVLARDRWRAIGAKRLPAVGSSEHDLWPADITPDFTDVDVAISRTLPGWDNQPAVRECEALFFDSIASAKRTIYIENQYFTNANLADALATRLAEPDGPEVVVAVPRDSHGWLEQQTIGALRDTLFRRLIASDPYKRLRIVAPVASRARDLATFVHSKVMVVDDTFVRIGSANCSHRSMGMDTECDVAIEARGSRGVRDGIRHIRDRLIAEHFGLPVSDVGPAIERAGSLRAFTDTHQHTDRALARIRLPAEPIGPPPDAVRLAVDPEDPAALGTAVHQVVPAVDASIATGPLRVWVVPVVALATAGIALWASSDALDPPAFQAFQESLRRIPNAPYAFASGIGVFVIGAAALIPLEVLAIASGVLFGGPGGVVAMTGSLVAAIAGYAAGRALGTVKISRWMSRRSYRSGRQLAARGVTGIAALRLAAVASAGAIHLLCGAARVPLGPYLAGTAIGSAPAVVALVWLGAVSRQALLYPSLSNGLAAIAAGLAVAGLALGVRTLLLIRQFAPAVAGHRQRAEFG